MKGKLKQHHVPWISLLYGACLFVSELLCCCTSNLEGQQRNYSQLTAQVNVCMLLSANTLSNCKRNFQVPCYWALFSEFSKNFCVFSSNCQSFHLEEEKQSNHNCEMPLWGFFEREFVCFSFFRRERELVQKTYCSYTLRCWFCWICTTTALYPKLVYLKEAQLGNH